MNPFIDATVAPAGLCRLWRRPSPPAASRPVRRVRRAWRRAFSAMLMTAVVGLGAPCALAVDVNQASAQQLETIRGIGPRTAEVIVNERERGGRFESFEDLAERVRGIGQKKAQALEAAGLKVGDGAATATSALNAPASSAANPPANAAAKSAANAAANAAASPTANSASGPASKPVATPASKAAKPSAQPAARP